MQPTPQNINNIAARIAAYYDARQDERPDFLTAYKAIKVIISEELERGSK